MAEKEETVEWTNTKRHFRRSADRFSKRSLCPHEFITTWRGDRYEPPQGRERLRNEAACLRFIQERTTVPVPEVLEAYEDGDGAFVLVTKLLPGVQMCELSAAEQAVVMHEVENCVKQLRSLKSNRTGGPTGIVCLPPRITKWFPKVTEWLSTTPGSAEPELVFCHGDLSQTNILVDRETLKIQGILDWEFAGFWPGYFEAEYFRDPLPSGAQFQKQADNTSAVDFLVRQGHKAG